MVFSYARYGEKKKKRDGKELEALDFYLFLSFFFGTLNEGWTTYYPARKQNGWSYYLFFFFLTLRLSNPHSSNVSSIIMIKYRVFVVVVYTQLIPFYISFFFFLLVSFYGGSGI